MYAAQQQDCGDICMEQLLPLRALRMIFLAMACCNFLVQPLSALLALCYWSVSAMLNHKSDN